jgi:tetratricopeptide (TPR) repeat protein
MHAPPVSHGPAIPAPPSRRRAAFATAAILGIALGGLSGACGDTPSAPPAPPAGSGSAPGAPKTKSPRDPAVEKILASRPDLAKTKVVVLGMDGLDPDTVKRLAGEGRLPHFRRLLDHGAFGPLRTTQPILSPILWTTIATGKWATEHGILDFMRADPKDPSKRVPVTSDLRQVEAVWDIAGRYGKEVGLVGWLASHPAEHVNGFAVSERNEHLAYLFKEQIPPTNEGKAWPPDLAARVQRMRKPPTAFTAAHGREFMEVTDEEWAAACTVDEFQRDNRINNLRLILQAATNFRSIGRTLWEERKPALFCSYFEAVDATGHYFSCYESPPTWNPKEPSQLARMTQSDPAVVARAAEAMRTKGNDAAIQVLRQARVAPPKIEDILEGLQGADAERVRKWGKVIENMYAWHDGLLGEWMDAVDREQDAVLVLVSDHGFATGASRPPWDSNFSSRPGGASYHRQDGVLGLYGKGVRDGFEIEPYLPARRNRPAQGAIILDIAPTVLALLGLPKGEDMPGRVIAEAFTRTLATETVPSHEAGRALRLARERVAAATGSARRSNGLDPDEEKQQDKLLNDLLAVGYVGTSKDAPVRIARHLAVQFLQQGKLQDALDAFREALAAATGDERLGLLVQIHQTMMKLGKTEEAKAPLKEALQINPRFLPGLVALAQMHDRSGDAVAAVRLWEQARTVDAENPEFAVYLASSLRERAVTLQDIEEQHADLTRALDLLDEAEALVALARSRARTAAGLDPATGDEGSADDEEEAGLGPAGHNIRGMVLLDLGDHEGAREEFERAAKDNEHFIRPRNNLGVLHMRLAMVSFQRAQEAANGGATAEIVESHGAEMRRNADRAVKWFDDILLIDPEYHKAYCNRAEVRLTFPPVDHEAARNDLDEALRIDPNYRRAKAMRDRLAQVTGETPPPGPAPGGGAAPVAPPSPAPRRQGR